MASEGYLCLTDGTFSLIESDEKNVFYFYRNDKKELGDVGRKPIDMYMLMMLNGEMKQDIYAGKICLETSIDDTTIRLTAYPFDFEDTDSSTSE